jgi:hypothetical protein
MGIITGIILLYQIVHQALRYRIIVHQPEVLQQIVHQQVNRKDLLLRHVLQPQTVSQKEHHLRPGRQLQISHPEPNPTTRPVPDRVLHQFPDQALHLHPDRVSHRVPDQ